MAASIPIVSEQSRQCASDRADWRSPALIPNSARPRAPAALSSLPAQNSGQCSENVEKYRKKTHPPLLRRVPRSSTDFSAWPARRGAPDANYQCALQFGTPASLLPSVSSYLSSFCAPQFRASRSRVHSLFFFTGPHYMFRQYLQRPLLRRFAKRFLHDRVFPRVVRQNDAAPLWIHCGGDPRKKLPEFLHLSIHRYPQRQKRFCRGMQSLPSPLRSGPCHNRCQVRRISDRPRSYDRPGDSSGIVLVRFAVQQVGKFFLLPAIHNFVFGQLVVVRAAPHAHAHPPPLAARKSPPRLLNPHTRHPPLPQDPPPLRS